MADEKGHGDCCKSEKKCCGCKKFFVGVLAGLAIAVIAHCFLCGSGGMCHTSSKMMCPFTQTQAPAK